MNMEFIVSRNSLLRALQHVRCAITKQEIQVFKNFVFSFESEMMTVHASNGQLWMKETIVLDKITCERRPIAIYYDDILKPIKALDEQPLRFEVYEYQVIVHHSIGSFRLPLYGNASEFFDFKAPTPDVEADDGWQLEYEAPCLKSILGRCNFAMAQDELRPVMNGVYFNLTDEFCDYVSSDGHKLVCNRNSNVKADGKSSFILPKKPASLFRSLIGKEAEEITIEFDSRIARFSLPEFRMVCRLIDGRYPNYGSVIPQNNPHRLVMDRQTLVTALRRVSVFSPASSGLIKLRIDKDKVDISAQDIDFSTSAKESLVCQYEGVPMSIGFKAAFLIDILNNIPSQEITIQLADPSRAGVIVPTEQAEGENLLMLLMPMVLND